jgi:hypothetical protein
MLQNLSFTSSFERTATQEVARFLVRFLGLLCIPGFVAIGFVVLLSWRTATTTSPVDIARMQILDSTLAWNGDGQLFMLYKDALVEGRKSDIIMLGHSRAGQLRSMMFKPYVFTNAGLTAWTIDQVRQSLEFMTRSHRPKVAMFNLDYFMLNAEYRKVWSTRVEAPVWTERHYQDGFMALGQMLKAKPITMLERLPIAMVSRYREEVNGLWLLGHGIASSAGFRADGSVLYDPVTRRNAPQATLELPRLLPTVAHGTGKRIDPGELEKLRGLVQLAKERGVILVGVQLPYFKLATDVLDSGADYGDHRDEDNGIWREFISPETKAMFEEMGLLFYDLSHHPAAADARGFIDIAHPSEFVTLAAFVDMFKDTKMRLLLPDLDIAALERTLDQARRSETFFDVYRAQF